jgi:hypothetical protein
MSIQVMNAVWEHSKSSGRARVVLLAIADHQGEIGAWPSIATLAKRANASERSVQRDIQELVELGELKVDLRDAPTRGQYKANRYWVTLAGVVDSHSEVTDSFSEVTDLTSEVTESPSEVTAGGVLTLNRTITKPLRETSYRLPDDWQPKDDDIRVMSEHFPEIDLKLETHAFRDYWRAVPGAKGRKSDWDATWRNWIRNSFKRSKGKAKPTTDWDALDRWAREQDDK